MPITRFCEHCGKAVTRSASHMKKRTFCSKACWYTANRKPVTTVRRMLNRPGHPLASKTGLVVNARAVLYDKIGPGWHCCHWCGAKVRWQRGHAGPQKRRVLIADHVDSNPLNDAPGNLVPACISCNNTRWEHIREDETYIVRPDGTRRRATERTCATCGKTFLFVDSHDKRHRTGIYCSLACLWNRSH